ncbi:MAG TPA: hypothetical protein VIL18_04930 [Longimicrobiales bacterium]
MDLHAAIQGITHRRPGRPKLSLASWRARMQYARAHWLHRREGDTQAALVLYRSIIDRWPNSPEARYARIHIRNISRGAGLDAGAAREARLPALDSEATGHWLRQRVAECGQFVAVRIPNVYDTVQTLAAFFRGQQREWVAVCLLDEAFVCNLIWVNGGELDQVRIRFGVETFVRGISPYVGARHIIVAHNHPIPSLAPGDRRRRGGARPDHADLERLTAFSEQDHSGSEAWRSYCRLHGLGHAEVLYASRNILIGGDRALVDEWRAHRPPPRWRLRSMLARVLMLDR